ncbi:MAG TPA: aminotransferase class III-fold pyridoxal phosphate-dependent enzyme, partial [Burkholderiales bacterium]|nr:aminotransferase class III-fold pyridoxal phosphate-dependent enzyme [Burkholderiales bacterium]
VLFIADEIQTGLGRTGALLACDHEGVKPDGLILGKALGGGLLPVSAFLAREDVMNVFRPGDHGSTFGGYPLACAVALEALDVLIEENLIQRAAELGAHFYAALSAIRSPLVKEVRGRGLMIGMELDEKRVDPHAVVLRLMERGILSKDTHDTVLRFTPPLVVEKAQLDWAVEQVRETLKEF